MIIIYHSCVMLEEVVIYCGSQTVKERDVSWKIIRVYHSCVVLNEGTIYDGSQTIKEGDGS